MRKEGNERLIQIKGLTIEEYYKAFPKIEEWMRKEEQRLFPKADHKQEIRELCEDLTAELYSYPAWMKVHILSFCMKLSGSLMYAEQLMQETLDADYNDLGEYSKYFLYWQIGSSIFGDTKLQSKRMDCGRARLYRELYQAFRAVFPAGRLSYIPLAERNKDVVFVFTSQFLKEMHGPTKTVCDRAYFLQKHLGKKVTIINTAMMTPQKGDTPFYKRVEGGYVPEYLGKTNFQFKDEVFGFFQCGTDMPDLSVIDRLLCRIREEKPYCVVSIGGGDLCADLCGEIVPEIVIGTVMSEITISTGTFQVTEKELLEEDGKLLKILGVKAENVSRALFTFVFKEQKKHYTRRQLLLPEDAKLLLVSGWRLSHEVQEDFLQMLERVLSFKMPIEVVFMGLFEDYEQKIASFTNLREHSHYLAYIEDPLAVTELCDLYLNPKRKGGGTSAAEALFKGLPAVTLPYGDVAGTVSEAFWVRDYEEMEEAVKRYCVDPAYYEKMSELAKQRAAELTDSRKHFCRVFEEIVQKPDFR